MPASRARASRSAKLYPARSRRNSYDANRILPLEMDLEMKMARVILFTAQMEAMSRYYGEVLGLKLLNEAKGWREFSAGGATIALHSGPSSPGRKGPKIVFHAEDVAAMRETLVARGARFGKVRQGDVFCLC